MKIRVNLHNSFITFDSFRRTFIVSGRLHHSNPAYFDGPVPAAPFIFDKMLYVPLSVDGRTAGLLHASVSCAPAYHSGFHALPDAAAIAKAGLKISSQCENLLKQVDSGSQVFNSSGGAKAFRCRPDDAVKALAMGLLALDSDAMVQAFMQADHQVESYARNMTRSERNHLVLDACRDNSIPKDGYGVKRLSSWGASEYMADRWYFVDSVTNQLSQSSIGTRMSAQMPALIVRTAAEVDSSQVHKWRKPPHSSMWPWTLDHHWFLCESSPIATAHHSMMALMNPSDKLGSSGNNGANKAADVCQRLPLVQDQLTMDKMRKLMEAYFQDLESTLSASGPRYAEWHRSNDDLRWVGVGRYSLNPTGPEESPTVMCMVLGVRPRLEGKNFKGFAPAENSLLVNTQRFHCFLTPPQINNRDPRVAFVVMYSCGLISATDFKNVMGKSAMEYDPAREAGQVTLGMGPLVTALLARNSWYSGSKKCLSEAVLREGMQPPLSEANLSPKAEPSTDDPDDQ